MRLVKLAIISAIVLFLVVFLLSLLIPGNVRISRAINISASTDSLVRQLTDLRQWQHWNEMVNSPQQHNPAYTATSFTSDQVQVKLQQAKTDTVFTSWMQQSGKEIASGFTYQSVSGTIVVQWYFDIELEWYPWEKFGSIVFDKQLGPPMERSLANLKKVLEKTP